MRNNAVFHAWSCVCSYLRVFLPAFATCYHCSCNCPTGYAGVLCNVKAGHCSEGSNSQLCGFGTCIDGVSTVIYYDVTIICYNDTIICYDVTIICYDGTTICYDGTIKYYDGVIIYYDGAIILMTAK